jgi:hypothetical protein
MTWKLAALIVGLALLAWLVWALTHLRIST